MTPTRNVALCVELGQRPIHALMTREDWATEIDRVLHESTTSEAVVNEAQPSRGFDPR